MNEPGKPTNKRPPIGAGQAWLSCDPPEIQERPTRPEIRPTGRRVGGRTEWQLTSDYWLTIPMGRGSYRFSIPAGTCTDLASVPRLLWPIVNPTDPRILAAALIHDDLYKLEQSQLSFSAKPGNSASLTKAPVSRFLADALFRHVMALHGAPAWLQLLAYAAVRAAGWAYFRKQPAACTTTD